MSAEDAKLRFSENQLKDIWCDLNVFKWPKLWPIQLKPDWWTNERYSHQKQEFIRPYMREIEMLLGRQTILRRWRDRKCAPLPSHHTDCIGSEGCKASVETLQ